MPHLRLSMNSGLKLLPRPVSVSEIVAKPAPPMGLTERTVPPLVVKTVCAAAAAAAATAATAVVGVVEVVVVVVVVETAVGAVVF